MKYLTEEDLNDYFSEIADCYKKDWELYKKYLTVTAINRLAIIRLFIQLQEADKIKYQLSKRLRDDGKN